MTMLEYAPPPIWLNAHIHVPAYAIVVGNPAQVIRYWFKPETIERLLEISWWDWESAKIAANLDLLYTNPDEWQLEIQLKESQGDVLKFQGMPTAEKHDEMDG